MRARVHACDEWEGYDCKNHRCGSFGFGVLALLEVQVGCVFSHFFCFVKKLFVLSSHFHHSVAMLRLALLSDGAESAATETATVTPTYETATVTPTYLHL